MTFSNFSSVIRMRNASAARPALDTSTSTGPWCSSTSLKARSTASLSVTSHSTPNSPSGAPDERWVTATLWPSAASRRATASPIPRFPPVTSTDRDTNAGLPPSGALSVAFSVAVSVTQPTYRLGAVGPKPPLAFRERNATAKIRAGSRRGVTLARAVGGFRHASAMTDPFLGSEALAERTLSRYELRSRYVALYQDVYVPMDAELTPVLRAKASWLRSQRRGVLAGFSASALHGARWIDPARPAAIIDTNRRPVPGVQVWEERIEPDEIVVVGEMRVTTPARTALDLARRYP